jgi:hypothetical protein
MPLLAIAVASSLLALSGLHIFWGFGGKWGALAAVPSKADGTILFQPGLVPCLGVAFGLGATAWLALIAGNILPNPLAAFLLIKLLWGVAGIFTIRCVGDFNYVGFFRKIHTTDFGARDRNFYTPLCLCYATAFAMLALQY